MRAKKSAKKAAVLLLVFVAVLAAYFLWPQKKEKASNIIYTAMEESTLPVVYPQMQGREMGPLFGHMEEMAVTADRDSLIVLPEDRKLPVRISDAQSVSGLSYEIRSMDSERLVERTNLDGWQRAEGSIEVQLPIQNLLEKDTEYLLNLCADLSDGRKAYYYTRIMESDNAHVEEMLTLAEDFSRKTLDYNEAQELTMYMESSPIADNSTFGNVTLKSSFSQITWGSLGVERTGTVYMKLKELNGSLANIQLDYYVQRAEGEKTELYAVSENFTMKSTERRVFMMDFKREMNQVFSGDRALYSGKRILLGISDGTGLCGMDSANKKFDAFVVNRELWCYDEENCKTAKVFSFGGSGTDALRENYDRHDIRILDVTDAGEIDFLVYGYMNRGGHEGYTGITLYHYDYEKNTIREQFFVPVREPYGQLRLDMDQFSHKGANGILYLMADGAVYGIDLTSFEYVVVASGLTDDKYAVSADGSRLAWQDDTGAYESGMIHVMDLDTGEKTEIGDGTSMTYEVLGFVGNDCIYGYSGTGAHIMSNGRIEGLYLDAVEIMDRDGNIAMHYNKDGYVIRDVEVEDSRIHLECVQDTANGRYAPGVEDTLVCNADVQADPMEGIGWYASDLKEKVFFVQMEEDMDPTVKVRTTTPRKMTSEGAAVLDLQAVKSVEGIRFLAYGRGRLLGIFTKFADAAEVAYEPMGFVTDEKNRPVWVRGNKANAKNIRDTATAVRRMERYRTEMTGNTRLEGADLLLDASGCPLEQVLYFVGQNIPVLAYTAEGSFLYLTGYDQSTVTVYRPEAGATEKFGLEEAKSYFDLRGNDFICGLFTK